MGELTKDIPKPLLPIGEKTIIEYILDAIVACGVFHVIIVVGHKGDLIKNKWRGQYQNVSITFVENDAPLQSDNLYSLWCARNYISNGMIFLNGDTLFSKSILEKLLKDSHENGLIADAQRSEENPIVIHENEGRLVEIGHKIFRDVHGIAPGFYKLSQETSIRYFKEAEKVFTSGPSKGGFVIPLQRLAEEIHFQTVYQKENEWVNINTPSDYKRAQKLVLEMYQ